MSFFKRKGCCCGAITCACPTGSAWTNGRAASVGIRAVMTSVPSISAGTAPPWSSITGKERGTRADASTGNGEFVTARRMFWSHDGQIGPCGIVACEREQYIYGQGSEWTVSGTPADLATACDMGGFSRNNARCPSAGVFRSAVSTAFTVNGLTVKPDIDGVTWSDIRGNASVDVGVGADASNANNIAFEVTAAVSFTAYATFTYRRPTLGPDGECDGGSEAIETVGYWGWSVRWFYGKVSVPKADLCGMAEVVVPNQLALGWQSFGNLSNAGSGGSGYSCPDIPDRGVWNIGEGGAFTLSLVDCAAGGGGFGTFAAPAESQAESAPEPTPDPEPSLIAAVLAEADA